ncbi:hypothetical protein Q5752_002321 [Cryptotrichosporon argae]
MRVTALAVLLPLAAAHGPARRPHARSFHALDARAGAAFNISTAVPNYPATSADTATSFIASAAASTTSSQADTETDSDTTTSSIAASSAVQTSSLLSLTVVSSAPQSSTDDGLTSSITSTSTSTTSTSSSVVPSTSSTLDVLTSSSTTDPMAVPSTTTSTTPTTTSTSTTQVSTTVVTRTSSTSSSVTTVRSTAAAASSSAASSSSSSGIGHTAIIAIVVVASVVGLAAAGWTIFRKWKLRPSNRFDERMKPINFSPHGGHDDFLEKTLQRTASNASADRQRQQLVAELDSSLVAGVPEHDFTAGGEQPYAYNDQYAYQEQYEYQGEHGYEAGGYPPAAGDANYNYDHPTQDEGYRYEDAAHSAHGPSASAHGHEQAMPEPNEYQPAAHAAYADPGYGEPQQYTQPLSPGGYADVRRDGGNSGSFMAETFPASDFELGRPTGGAEGPYAQAATYRGY